MFGFFWECLDVGYFVFLSFVSSILFPGSIEIVLFIIMMSYITIDDEKIVKKIGKKIITIFKWEEVREIKLDGGFIYISKKELLGTRKEWNKNEFIFVYSSDELKETIKANIKSDIKINFYLNMMIKRFKLK